MFEKLKEYGLYIILGLIALGALAYAYVQTSNSQKGAEIQEANVNAMMTALSKSDKLKKSSTVAEDLLAANGGRSIGKYKIDPDKVSYVIGETYNDVFDNKKMIDVSTDLSDLEEGQLRTILIAQPAATVNGEDVNTISLNSDKSLTIGENTITKDNLDQVANELKGYNVGAIGYAAFDTEQEAKDFRDTYFPSYEVYEIGETGKFVVLTEYNTTGGEVNVEGKIDATANGEGLGEQQEEQGTDTCNEYICLDANGVTLKAKAETVCGQEYEFQGNNYYVACNKNELRSKITNTYTRNRYYNSDTGQREREIATPKEYNANQIITTKITDMSFLFDEEWEMHEGEDWFDCMEMYREGDGIRYFTDASGVASWDTSNVTSMRGTFMSMSKFLSDDLSHWNTSKVTDMTGMFCGTGLTNMNLNNWNTSKVTDMSYMFNGSKFNGQIDQWNTSHVANMQSMFSYCSTFNQPIGSWNISGLSGYGFYTFLRYAESFNQDLSNWNLDNTALDGINEQVGNAFSGINLNSEYYPIVSKYIEDIKYDLDIEVRKIDKLIKFGNGTKELSSSDKTTYLNQLNTINNSINTLLTTEHDVYVQREVTKTNIQNQLNTLKTSINNSINTNGINTVACTDCIYLDSNGITVKAKQGTNVCRGEYELNSEMYFVPCDRKDLNLLMNNKYDFTYDVDHVVTTYITDMSRLFQNRRGYNPNVISWDVSNVTNMSYMFDSCKGFNRDISNWNVSHVTNMQGMFMDVQSFNQDISSWNTSNVTNMRGMFLSVVTRSGAPVNRFNQDLSGWNVSNVTDHSAFASGLGSRNASRQPQWNN